MKPSILILALGALPGSVFAGLDVIEDESLGNHIGQDGISLLMNIKVHIDSFQWIDNPSNGYGNGNGNGKGKGRDHH